MDLFMLNSKISSLMESQFVGGYFAKLRTWGAEAFESQAIIRLF